MPSGKDMRPVERVASGYPLFDAVEIRPDRHMVGVNKAVRFGNGPIYVSPAVYELIQKAETQHDLRHLLENIPLLTLSPMPKFV